MAKKKETVAQKALRLLSKVPPSKFIEDRFTDGTGKCCAIGHYKRLTSSNPSDFSDINCKDFSNAFVRGDGCDLRILSKKFITDKYKLAVDISRVNNSAKVNGYKQKSIKTRVINLLKNMVAEGL